MTTKSLLTTALEGGTPAITPLSIYSWMLDRPTVKASAAWQRLVDMGLGLCRHCTTFRAIEHGVTHTDETTYDGATRYDIHTITTPIGSIRSVRRNGWHHEDLLKAPQDYTIMQWVVEHTEFVPAYEEYDKAEAEIGDDGIVIVTGSRTPAMSINVDWAGTEQFCLDVALEVPELFELFAARKRKFLEETALIAAGPGRFVKWFENLTVSMIGPDRYRDLLVSVYHEAVPMLEARGKRVMVHYDGALSPIADQIAAAPFHMIESLTEPPEGDMTYDQCRAAWPDKVFWANINIDCYFLPPEQLRAAVIAKRRRAGKRAFAFELSEDLPANWETTIPIVLETLRELG